MFNFVPLWLRSPIISVGRVFASFIFKTAQYKSCTVPMELRAPKDFRKWYAARTTLMLCVLPTMDWKAWYTRQHAWHSCRASCNHFRKSPGALHSLGKTENIQVCIFYTTCVLPWFSLPATMAAVKKGASEFTLAYKESTTTVRHRFSWNFQNCKVTVWKDTQAPNLLQ